MNTNRQRNKMKTLEINKMRPFQPLNKYYLRAATKHFLIFYGKLTSKLHILEYARRHGKHDHSRYFDFSGQKCVIYSNSDF